MNRSPAERQAATQEWLDDFRQLKGRQAMENALRRHYASWGHGYFAFLARFLGAGYAIRGYDEFRYEDRDSKALYIQHDVHWLDIPGALCMMDMERQLGVRSSYSVMWDYRPFDVDKRNDYLLLRDFGDGDFDIGLHEAVLDEYFFEHHIGRENMRDVPLAHETRRHLRELIAETNVSGDALPDYFEPDPVSPGFLVFRDVANLPDGIFKEIIVASHDLLERRLESFRSAFGGCRVIHQHGGYAVQGTLDHWDTMFLADDRRRFLWAEKPDFGNALALKDARDRYGVMLLWLALTQNHRYRPKALLERLGVAHDSGLVVDRCVSLAKCGRVADSVLTDTDEFVGTINLGLERGRVVFTLLHGSLWEWGRYNDLTEPVVAGYRESQINAGNPAALDDPQSTLAHYRAALGRRAWDRYCRRFGDDWLADETAATGYLYSAGNFQARARRVWDLLAWRGLTGLLDGGSVIDLGGGLGTIASYLACRAPVRRLRVVDIDPEYLEFQRGVYDDLGWDFVDTEQSAFRDWQGGDVPADLVLSYGAFEFFHDDADIARIFDMVSRSLRPGGVFVANVWNHYYPKQGYSKAPFVQHLPTQALRLRVARMLGYSPNPEFRSLPHARWRQECRRAGMEEPEILYCDQKPDGFHFFKVPPGGKRKRTHIWVLARKPERTPAQ